MTHMEINTPENNVVAAIAVSQNAYEATDSWLLGIFDTEVTARELLGQSGWVEGEDYSFEASKIETLNRV